MSNNTNTKQSDASALVLAVEKLLDYHRRNSPGESMHFCKACDEMVETDAKLDTRGIIEICPKCYTEK